MRTCIAYINLKKQKNNITDIQYTSRSAFGNFAHKIYYKRTFRPLLLYHLTFKVKFYYFLFI